MDKSHWLVLFTAVLIIGAVAVYLLSEPLMHCTDQRLNTCEKTVTGDGYRGMYTAQRILPNDPGWCDNFGYAVAVDGNTVAVGAFEGVSHLSHAGSVYIFQRLDDERWGQSAKITPPEKDIPMYFGFSVALDGGTLAVGAYNDTTDRGAGRAPGAVYVFNRNDGVWEQEAKLYANDWEHGDQFGWSVALDGDTIIVGASTKDGVGQSTGAAYVFERQSGAWTQRAKLQATDRAAEDYFGHFVAIDNDTAVVGAMLKDNQTGAAYVFKKYDNIWKQEAKLQASDRSEGSWFGGVVALDGDLAIVSAEHEGAGGAKAGAAYLFRRNDDVWGQEAKLRASDSAEYNFFGESVAVQGDTVVVGAHGSDNGVGAAYIFKRQIDRQWKQIEKVVATEKVRGGAFGNTVAVQDGTVVVGAYRADATYIYNYDRSDSTY